MHSDGGRSNDRRPVTLQRVLSCPKLPSLPAVAYEVLELTRGDDVDLKAVADAIRNDQGLATKVIRTVNSSYYALSKPCATIHQAMVYLGLNTVKTIVLSFTLADTLDSSDESEDAFDFELYWRRTLYAAAAARTLAERTKVCPPEEAYLAAIMQDMGMIALLRALDKRYAHLVNEVGLDHRQLARAERDDLGLTHLEVGAELAKRWKLPDQFVEAVQHHEWPDNAPEEWRPLVRIVHLSMLVSIGMAMPQQTNVMALFERLIQSWFSVPSCDIQSILETIQTGVRELGRLFRVRTGELPPPEELMLSAEEQLVEHQLAVQRQQEELQRSNEELARRSTTDPLTGLANRGRFDDVLKCEFEAAHAAGGSVAVIFSDIDRFKGVNDTYGHQVGDDVIVKVAEVMQETVGENGLVARYGGEEIAVILPGMGRIDAARLAERVRTTLESCLIDISGHNASEDVLQVTASLGVAALEPAIAKLLTKHELLLRMADQAVYAAKSGGRNCVRVFCPKEPKSAAA